MNTIRYALLFLFFGALIAPDAISQCNSITLNNQQDINDFTAKYGSCSEVNYLTIRDRDGDIENFDSLYIITRINGSLNIQDFTKSNEINISGLKNLRYVSKLDYRLNNVNGVFNSLDTIVYLDIIQGSFAPFQNLKHIEAYLSIELTTVCSEEEIPFFTTGELFGFNINKKVGTAYDVAYKECIEVIASRIDFSKHVSLGLSVDSLNLDWFPLPDALRSLNFAYHQNSDLNSISNIKELKSFNISNDLGGNDYGAGLSHIEELESIKLSNINIEGIDYNTLFPSLISVNKSFILARDKFVTNLDFLEGVKAPELTDPKSYAYLVQINDNPYLSNCNVSFLCEVLKKYPDEVVLSNNAGLCTKAEVLKYCATVSTSDTNEKAIELTPNPVTDYLRIKGLDKAMEYQIYNACGSLMFAGTTESDVQVDHLNDGMYFIQLKEASGTVINKKFIKM